MASTTTFTYAGLIAIRHWCQNLSGSVPSAISRVKIGTGTNAIDATDTALQTEYMDVSATTSTVAGYRSQTNKARYVGSFSIGATKSITEIGLASGPSDVLFSRTVLTDSDIVNVNSGDTLTVTYDIDFRPV